MESEEFYKSLIPEKPPAGLRGWLCEQQEIPSMSNAVITFRRSSRKEIREMDDMIRTDLGTDQGRPALLHCLACDNWMTADWGKTERPSIRLDDNYYNASGSYDSYSGMVCPCCESKAVLLHTGLARRWKAMAVVTVPTVADGKLVLTMWECTRSLKWDAEELFVMPWTAYIVDGKNVVRLEHHIRTLGREHQLSDWKLRKRAIVRGSCPFIYDRNLPSLEGTSLENAKLWDAMKQTYQEECFCLLGYIKLYLTHPAAENLVVQGLALPLMKAITNSVEHMKGGMMPKVAWVNWKEKKPARMLGMDKSQYKTVLAQKWTSEDMDKWMLVREQVQSGAMSFGLFAEKLRKLTEFELKSMLVQEQPVEKICRYLDKQKECYIMLRDYWRNAELVGKDLEDPAVCWPRDLRAAHDRVEAAREMTKTTVGVRAFSAMTERCRGLNWQRDGICIRVAESEQELIEEGGTLHHCVDGYGRQHAEGQIILFIRHARRPERSWFTLNIDVRTKKIIQNHGYGNERSPKGKTLRIPKRVTDFVEAWEREVLRPWKLPPAPKKGGKTVGK